MKSFFLIICIVLNISYSFSQLGYFNKTYDYKGGYETAVAVTQVDNGYIFLSGGGGIVEDEIIVITKIDYSGEVVWEKAYGRDSFQYNGYTNRIVKTQDGNFVFGTTMAWPDFNYDAMLVKFDKNGDTLWIETFGGDSFDVFYDCSATKDGGLIAAGVTQSFNDKWNGNAYLVRTDKDGKLLWQKDYGNGMIQYGFSVEQTTDGGFIVGGYTDSEGEGVYVFKTDSIGTMEWDMVLKTYGAGGGAVIQCKDGNYVAYSSTKINGNREGRIAKIDAKYKYVMWDTTYGSKEDDWLEGMIELEDGSLVAIGTFEDPSVGSGKGWVLKMNQNGEKLWSHTYSFNQNGGHFWDVNTTSDNGLIACGYTQGSSGNQDMWVVKMDSNGYSCVKSECDSLTAIYENLNSITEPTLTIYPNPFNEHATIELNLFQNYEASELAIYDIIGKMVYLLSLEKGLNTITLPATVLNKGVYVYKLIGDDIVLTSGKMVVY